VGSKHPVHGGVGLNCSHAAGRAVASIKVSLDCAWQHGLCERYGDLASTAIAGHDA
jgi:hypothetical protein